MNFKEHLINQQLIKEALKIIKKAGSEIFDDAKQIGKFKEFTIQKSEHVFDKRNDKVRDENLENGEIVKIISRAFKNLKEGYNAIIYKTENGYNNLVVALSSQYEKITIITIIQQNRNKPNYFIKDGDNKVIVESPELIVIQLD